MRCSSLRSPPRTLSRSESVARPRVWLVVSLAVLSTSCEGVQSSLAPGGTHAERIDVLWWVLFGVSVFVFAVVLGLLLAALRPVAMRADDALADHRAHVAIGVGVAVTTIILLGLFLATLTVARLNVQDDDNVLTIRVVGKMWWWEVTYLDEDPRRRFTTANELRIPVGHPVRVELMSDNVIHSFWVPALNGKTDLIPGRINSLMLHATEAGTFRGQCAEFCGLQHAKMAFYVVAMPPDDFVAWLEEQRAPALQPSDTRALRGREVFRTSECARCHTLRGVSVATEEGRDRGPELTHIGSRLSLAAGSLPNTRGHLAGWIANPQSLKPGNRMPAVRLPSDDLLSLVHYLESLK